LAKLGNRKALFAKRGCAISRTRIQDGKTTYVARLNVNDDIGRHCHHAIPGNRVAAGERLTVAASGACTLISTRTPVCLFLPAHAVTASLGGCSFMSSYHQLLQPRGYYILQKRVSIH
jgi:hypothetical protein